MSIVSKEKSYVNYDYESSDELILQAVKELAPRWALYDRELEFFQWAWEFLRRNPDYRRLAIEALHALAEWHKNKNHESLTRFLSLAEKISNKYGLVVPLHPDEEITAENRWNEKLNGKYWSQAKVKAGTIEPGKIFIKPESHERVLVIDLNTPRQTYIRIINEMFAEGGLNSPIPAFQVSKFATYLKGYDLRVWGEQDGRAIREWQGKTMSCISWNSIGRYLSPRTPLSVQRVRRQHAAVEEYIRGGYKLLVKYKS